MQTITIIINELPYKNDKAWNAVRLTNSLLDQDVKVKIFLLEDGVDVGRENQNTKVKEYNLEELTKKLLARDVPFVACSTCIKVCGISHEKLIDGIVEGHMSDLAKLVKESEKILIF